MNRLKEYVVCVMLLAAGLALAACARHAIIAPAPSDTELRSVLNGESFSSSPETPGDLLAVSDAMREFVSEKIPAGLPAGRKLRRLRDALTESPHTARYWPGKTYTAAEAFDRGGGNCVSLTALFVALAREAGLDAAFNEVDVPPTWDRLSENRFAVYKHINAVVDVGGSRQTVELADGSYDGDYRQRAISDRQAVAQYYNNLAMELADDADAAIAFDYMRRAIAAEPGAGFLWGNLGTLYRRAGEPEKAGIAYRHAHNLDPADTVVMSNLAQLYRQLGKDELARRYSEAVEHHRRQNPYYRYAQARRMLAGGDAEAALRQIRAALRLDDAQHRFHYVAAVIYRQLGNSGMARSHLHRAIALSDDAHRASYQRQLEQLTASR